MFWWEKHNILGCFSAFPRNIYNLQKITNDDASWACSLDNSRFSALCRRRFDPYTADETEAKKISIKIMINKRRHTQTVSQPFVLLSASKPLSFLLMSLVDKSVFDERKWTLLSSRHRWCRWLRGWTDGFERKDNNFHLLTNLHCFQIASCLRRRQIHLWLHFFRTSEM